MWHDFLDFVAVSAVWLFGSFIALISVAILVVVLVGVSAFLIDVVTGLVPKHKLQRMVQRLHDDAERLVNLKRLRDLHRDKSSHYSEERVRQSIGLDGSTHAEIVAAKLPYAPLLVWNEDWTQAWRETTYEKGTQDYRRLLPGAIESYRLALEMQAQLLEQEIAGLEPICSQLQIEIVRSSEALGMNPIKVFNCPDPPLPPTRVHTSLRDELHDVQEQIGKLREREDVLVKKVLDEDQAGASPMRKAATISTKDNN
jgi:hypothetical protein